MPYSNTVPGVLTVATISDLPAGTYMVTGSETATLRSSASLPPPVSGGFVACVLTPGSAESMQQFDVVGDDVTVDALVANVVVTDAVTVDEGGSITLACRGQSPISSNGAIMTAIPVDALN
jgi:hypothetical protein